MMNTVTVELEVPEAIFLALKSNGLSRDELRERAALNLAVQLYAEGRLSLGKAAKIAGTNKFSFWALLIERGVAVFNYTEDDYEDDLATIERILAKQGKA
jgi:predicted HTH domain antitoxin